ncbi:hypothetical protein [Actinoallomurus iriomotensis]|uniref:Uncharacterized protein n=1 Tax=Actinoallomurus iriomotensis TaxID=478107 RepID=A0A9W6RL82_9ACTN|nr:hypothetical protein [Actinoallomurus iriomotensis]GLY77040.1 hypothetical protein Airi01_053070 [Actinoallomurus iriomotensis]
MKYNSTSLIEAADGVNAALDHYYQATNYLDIGVDMGEGAENPDGYYALLGDKCESYEQNMASTLNAPFSTMKQKQSYAMQSTVVEMKYVAACLRYMAKTIKNAEEANIGDIETVAKQLKK